MPKGQKEKVVSFTSIVLLKINSVKVGNGLDGFAFYGGDAKFTLVAESVPELTELTAFIETIESFSNKKVEAGLEKSYGILLLCYIIFLLLYCLFYQVYYIKHRAYF